jgi:quinol monooxygenase YgiN
MSYLYLALHYPKPEHMDDLLAAMQRLNLALQGAPGLLQIGAWREESGPRIVAISLWESQAAFQAALGRIASAVADVPFAEWEQRPRELIRATGLALPT